ncbi:hypothetical protein HNR23_003301 [Nocardiopsis mwathae]|uniref:DUF2511 domain-containing protein n=1 Tax=Nocardiopsis mwathae TaxID=1472723 RepID=A0A7X0D704_9ACTN|nr:hypothetical protein [Nocardiopsis mwathae]MBB6173241.1 hypothetical protein [Nocardiopsis mwathae]
MRPTLAILLLLGGVGLLSACAVAADEKPDGEEAVTRSAFERDGKTWPLVPDSAELRCYRGEIVTATVDGTEYQLNSQAQREGFPSIEPVWADAADSRYDLKVNLGELIDAGTGLCAAPR